MYGVCRILQEKCCKAVFESESLLSKHSCARPVPSVRVLFSAVHKPESHLQQSVPSISMITSDPRHAPRGETRPGWEWDGESLAPAVGQLVLIVVCADICRCIVKAHLRHSLCWVSVWFYYDGYSRCLA